MATSKLAPCKLNDIDKFFSLEYHGNPFVLFGPAHWIAAGIILAIALTFNLPRHMWNNRARRSFRLGLAGWLSAWEIARHAWFAVHSEWNIQTMLPLHLCSISVWLSIYTLATKSRFTYEPLYFFGLGGATQGLITPSILPYGFPHFHAFQDFAAHGGIVLATLYLTQIEGFRPTFRSVINVILFMTAYVPFVFILNQAIGSNYLFLAGKPDFPTLIDKMSPWPWYIVELSLVALAVAMLLYIPFFIRDWRTGRWSALAALNR